MKQVEREAREQNGWHVVATARCPEGEGTVPNGLVVFEREQHPFPDSPWGVAAYAIHQTQTLPSRVVFHSGDYDLSEVQAIKRFAERLGQAGFKRIPRPTKV